MLLPKMSSTSSNPDDGDTTEQSQLGLDTVIKVSEVAVPSVTPGEQVLRALLNRTLPGMQLHPLPPSTPHQEHVLPVHVLSVNMSVQVQISRQAKQIKKPAPLWSPDFAACIPRWKGQGEGLHCFSG